jgi:hypothetical protein
MPLAPVIQLMFGLTALDTWKDYFHNPQGGTLGVFNAIQTIGGLSSLLLSPYAADIMGRRYSLFMGLTSVYSPP